MQDFLELVYKEKVEELSEYNVYLNKKINKIPKIIRKFILNMDEPKLLKQNKTNTKFHGGM